VRERDVDFRQYRLRAKESPLLGAESERELLCRARKGDQTAVARIVESHMRLVVQIASAYAREGLSAHDLVGEGTLGLMEAVRRFDVTRDTRFASYAAWWVRACVRRYALDNRRIVGVPSTRGARIARSRLRGAERSLTQRLGRPPTRAELAQNLGVSEQDVELVEVALSSRDVSLTAPDDAACEDVSCYDYDPEQAVAEAEARQRTESAVRDALAHLSDRELALVREQFFEDDGRSLADLGRALGVSRQRAGQILAAARGKLRAELTQVA
jgi:RNA polymerase sigma-32 factor